MSTNTSDQTSMVYRQLGQNGPIVSRLSLGTMTFGAETDEAEACRQLDYFADHGGTFIDTADVYSGGVSEEIIGNWIKKHGGLGKMILATKGRFSPPSGSYGGAGRAIIKSLETSLQQRRDKRSTEEQSLANPRGAKDCEHSASR